MNNTVVQTPHVNKEMTHRRGNRRKEGQDREQVHEDQALSHTPCPASIGTASAAAHLIRRLVSNEIGLSLKLVLPPGIQLFCTGKNLLLSFLGIPSLKNNLAFRRVTYNLSDELSHTQKTHH